MVLHITLHLKTEKLYTISQSDDDVSFQNIRHFGFVYPTSHASTLTCLRGDGRSKQRFLHPETLYNGFCVGVFITKKEMHSSRRFELKYINGSGRYGTLSKKGGVHSLFHLLKTFFEKLKTKDKSLFLHFLYSVLVNTTKKSILKN